MFATTLVFPTPPFPLVTVMTWVREGPDAAVKRVQLRIQNVWFDRHRLSPLFATVYRVYVLMPGDNCRCGLPDPWLTILLMPGVRTCPPSSRSPRRLTCAWTKSSGTR